MANVTDPYHELLTHLHRRPFVPFVVVRNDGKRFEVSERFHMALSESTVAVVPPNGQGPHDVFRTNQVAAVQIMTPSN